MDIPNESHDPVVEARILKLAAELFFQYGYTKITTDEIAERLAISKKTLYKYFPKKEMILQAVFVKRKDEILKEIEQIIQNSDYDLIDKVKLILKTAAIKMSFFSKPLIKDLKSKFPFLWEQIKTFESDELLKQCEGLVEAGIKEGVFKPVFNTSLVVRFYFEAIKNVLTTNIIEELPISVSELFDSVLIVMFDGVLSEKGRIQYAEKLS
ncbi:MAG: TetR/AcrR family transcriptional regulator [Spirochaetes bacterium]|nr:TetR/AcrR family transcriptional regulator [Spirochaetota bacterium]